MANYRTSRILPIILVIVIIIIAIAALVSLARVVFFSGSTTSKTAAADVSRDALLNTSVGRSVSMTVRGPIVADEEFQSYRINISPNTREVTTYKGYLDTVVNTEALTNNVASYEQFVYALDKANFPTGKELSGDKNDVRGICATGRVYEFKILNNGTSVKSLWTSTCKGSSGSLNASTTQLTSLFVAQIPDADKLIKKVNL
ncbi:MAG: hypothetical protein ABIP50_00410 [Candidatus Saccharimonadales bacterium]